MAKTNKAEKHPTESIAQGVEKPKPLDEDSFQAAVRRLIDDTDNFIEDDVSPIRERAWRYFNGETDLRKPPAGRSNVVMSEVRDVVEATIPGLMDIFTASGDIVEFKARNGGNDVQMAKQSTALCNYCFWNENPGWEMTHDVMKSGLVARTAALKVFWRNRVVKDEEEYEGLSPQQFMILKAEESVEIVEANEITDTVVTAEGGPQEIQTIDCTITRETKEGFVEICPIPPEEFVIDRRATNYRDAILIGQRTEMRVTDLMEMDLPGVTYEQLVALAQEAVTDEELEQERQSRTRYVEEEDYDDTQDQTKYVPTWDIIVRIDADGDGIAEYRHVIACGEPVEVLLNERADSIRYIFASPIRIPHTAIGRGQADLTMDLQDISTHIVRQTIDNITNVNNPRKEVVEGQVNMVDLLDNRFSGVVRTRAPGMITELTTPFVGDKSLAILDYIEHKQEMRTGISKQTMGLDADALQSMAETGVRGTLGAAQQKLKLIARTYAQTLFVPLFRTIQQLYVQHQDKPKTIRLMDDYIEIDPRSWHADMDVEVKVGLGTGDKEEKIAALMMAKATQEQILVQMGPMNPLVSLEQYAHTLRELAKLGGLKDVQSYFTTDTEIKGKLEQWMKQQQQANKDDGKAAEAQAKQMEVQAKIQLEQQKAKMDFQLKQQRLEAEIAMEREKMAAQLQLDRERMMQELNLKAEEMAAEAKLSAIKLSHGLSETGDTNIRNPS